MIDFSKNPFLELGGVRHALDLAGLQSVEELAKLAKIDVLRIDGVRPGDVRKIEAWLAKRGLALQERDDRTAAFASANQGRRSADRVGKRHKPGFEWMVD